MVVNAVKIIRFTLARQMARKLLGLVVSQHESPKSVQDFFDFRCWPSKKQRHFILNLLFGALILAVLELLPLTRFGQNLINETHDYVIKKSFEQDIQHESSIAQGLRLVLLDKNFYEKDSPSLGYWTPRERLGKTINYLLDQGTKVLLIDVRLDRPAPDSVENEAFLKEFKKAVNSAKSLGATLIIPQFPQETHAPETNTDYVKDFWDIVRKNRDVIKEGDAGILRHPQDNKIRHLRFYRMIELDGRRQPLLSIALLATAYAQGQQTGDKICQQFIENIQLIEKGAVAQAQTKISEDINVLIFRQLKGQSNIEARLKFNIAPQIILSNKKTPVNPRLLHLATTALGIQYSRPGTFTDNVVLLGADYPEISDTHFTPIGTLPGIYILANAVNMFLTNNQVHDNFWLITSIKIATILLISLTIIHLSALFDIILLIIVFLAFRPLSVYLFSEFGILFNVFLVTAGISIFDYVNCASEFICHKLSPPKAS